MMTAIAIIPARGGSKGLQGKNLRPVGGLPLVARAVVAARAASRVSRVFVSTDDAQIAAAAKAHGAEIVWRPAEISDDAASSESALLHVLDHLEREEAVAPVALVFIQCTSPFVTPGDIDGTLAEVLDGDADSAFAVAPFHYFVWRRDGEGRALGVNHSGGMRQRRQDSVPQYLEAGSVYAMKTDIFRREKNRFCGRQVLYIVQAARMLEIDDAADLERAQALAPLIDTAHGSDALPNRLSAIVFDFDGVFTDNGVFVDEDGGETVRCDRSDGMGVASLKARAVPMLVISKERSPVVARRCEKLGVDCLQGVDDKLAALKEWLMDRGIAPDGVIYVGNDVNDLECLQFATCAAGPHDAHPDVRPFLHLTLRAAGGRGAVRELADHVCKGLDEGRIALLSTNVEAPSTLKANAYRAGEHDKRPWGSWEVLAADGNWCVKRLDVKPGQILSLQSHQYRDEAWVVAEGVAQVTIGEEVHEHHVGETAVIPRRTRHRLANAQQEGSLTVIEVQSGDRLDENDIQRFEDVYQRVKPALGEAGE